MAMQYEFRPAKAAQRRMIVDACRRLTAVAPLDQYQYVGFGALEFIDFIEFHRSLGISKMTSIERNTQFQHRLEFNKPYKSIQLLIGEARDRLPDIDWDDLSITWLDYTDLLSTDILRDIEYVLRSSIPASVLIVTVNGGSEAALPKRLPELREKLGHLVPDTLTDADMNGWGPAREQRRILQDRANSVVREAHRGEFQQLFNFEYADGAKMLTWGGIITNPSSLRAVEACRFDDLMFVTKGETPFEIRVPFLTEREMEFLEGQIGGAPSVGSVSTGDTLKGVTPAEVKAFAGMYRWRTGTR
jgi:hypothetical protein